MQCGAWETARQEISVPTQGALQDASREQTAPGSSLPPRLPGTNQKEKKKGGGDIILYSKVNVISPNKTLVCFTASSLKANVFCSSFNQGFFVCLFVCLLPISIFRGFLFFFLTHQCV